MSRLRIVLDTNVLVSALRSRRGASHQVLTRIGSGLFDTSISVALFLEYEDAAKRLVKRGGLSTSDIDVVLNYVASSSDHQRIFYLWRPYLRDVKDDMVLELAVAAQADAIITYNARDYKGIEHFVIRLLKPHELLEAIGET